MGVGPRRLLTVRDGLATIVTRPVSVSEFSPDLPSETFAAPDPLTALRQFLPRRRILPSEGIPRFPGGAVGALAYDAVSTFEPTVPLPDRDPIGVPMAAFQETDLVLVFDHLTHTLSAVASLHTETPDLEGRYAIAERAIFDALDRTGRPTELELAGLTRRTTAVERTTGARPGEGASSDEEPGSRQASAAPGGAPGSGLRQIEVSMERGEYEAAVSSAKEAIAAGRGDPDRRRPAPDLRATGRRRLAAGRRGAVPVAAPHQPEPVPLLRPDAGVLRRRGKPGAARPGRGRPHDHPPDRRHAAARRHAGRGCASSPTASSATRRNGRST